MVKALENQQKMKYGDYKSAAEFLNRRKLTNANAGYL